jgi:hypothetical protein
MWKIIKAWLRRFNWCEPLDPEGEDKPESRLYDFYCRLFWPIPWQEQPCWCCASVRGIIYGLIVGWTARWLWEVL